VKADMFRAHLNTMINVQHLTMVSGRAELISSRKIKTMKKALGALLLICLATSAVADDQSIGFRKTTLPDARDLRPLELVVWYPSATTATPQLIADNQVFFGVLAVPDAKPAAGEHPLVVLSHGYLGNWGKQAWLASALAHKGYIVAAVNLPGSTTLDQTPEAAEQLWRRPMDLNRAITAVLAQPKQFGVVEKGRITAVGHSLGGWTAMEIAGARFDPDRFAQDCSVHPKLASCTVYQVMNPANTPSLKTWLSASLRDQRVSAVV